MDPLWEAAPTGCAWICNRTGRRSLESPSFLDPARVSPAAPFPIKGNVAADLFRFAAPRGAGSGELTVSGDDMNGQFRWSCGAAPMSLHRVDSLSRTGSPPR